jgi:hypothetical protein
MTLEPRVMDAHDAVWTAKDALRAAFELGRASR